MYTLAIDTASSHTSLALFKDGQALSSKSWLSNNDEAEKLMPAIEDMLGDEVTYEEIENILVVKGPGSFTGLRIGVATANTIAHFAGCNLYAISTFEYLWLQAPADAALVLFAGKGGVYVSLTPEEEGKIVDMPDVNEYLENNNVTKVFGDISDEQKQQIDAQFVETNYDFADTVSKIDLQSLKKEKLVNPLYIKQPSITQK